MGRSTSRPRERRVPPHRHRARRELPADDVDRSRLVVAEAIDWTAFLAVCGLTVAAGALLGASVPVLWLLGLVVAPALLTAYEIVGVALWGQTLGKRIAGLRVVGVDTGTPPGWRRAAKRTLLPVPFFRGEPLPRFVTRTPRVHDRVAGTTVVRCGSRDPSSTGP